MIKRLRKRFILICTVSFFTVFVVMVTAIFAVNTVRQNNRLDMLADVLSENGGSFPEPKDSASEHTKPLPAFFNTETPFVTRFYTVNLDADGSVQSSSTEFISDVSAQDIERSTAAVLKKGRERGWYGDFRY